jgi:class 3 adenylate cyclase
VKFAGDALIFYWKSNQLIDLSDTATDIARGELVFKASQCCLRLLSDLGTYPISIADCDTKSLRIHLGIGAGIVFDVIVGNEKRQEHFIGGDGIRQLGQVLDLAKAGELALSHSALKHLAHVIDIRTLNLGNYDKRCIILTSLEKAERKVSCASDADKTLVESNNLGVVADAKEHERYVDLFKCFMDESASFKLQADIEQARLFNMRLSIQDILNLSDLRQVTTIFIKIGSLQIDSRSELLEESQIAIDIVLNALARFEGSLRQFHVDDKGAVILCFFGLPPLAHDNDAKTGLFAAMDIKKEFSEFFDTFSIGVTTGVVAFGGIGQEGRSEFAVLGDAINMAARIMCLPEAFGDIICDEKTYNLCKHEIEFEHIGEVKVKGKAEPISIFSPEALKTQENISAQDDEKNILIGRDAEKSRISHIIHRVKEEYYPEATFFEGAAGQGLTSLSEYLKRMCESEGVSLL